MTPSMEKKLAKLEKEFLKRGEEDFLTEIRRASFEILENRLKDLSKHLQAIDETKERDEELKAAREQVNQLSAPYREQKAWNAKRSKLIYLIMCEEHASRMLDYGSES